MLVMLLRRKHPYDEPISGQCDNSKSNIKHSEEIVHGCLRFILCEPVIGYGVQFVGRNIPAEQMHFLRTTNSRFWSQSGQIPNRIEMVHTERISRIYCTYMGA